MHNETEATQHFRRAALAAREASRVLAGTSEGQRNSALRIMATSLRDHRVEILAANAADLGAFKGTNAFRDRLTLNETRVDAMADGLEDVAALPDPLGRILADWTRPNGLRIQRIATPIGVIGMIYESRPNVGADASALCLKSGNAVILRGGSDSLNSARAINIALVKGLEAAGLPPACIQVPPNTDRAYVAAMLAGAGLIDLIIPRGGKSLVERVQREARVPVLAHAEGLCHTYVHAAADPDMARAIVVNAQDAPYRRLRSHRDAVDRPLPSPPRSCRRLSPTCERSAAISAPTRRLARSCRSCRPRTMRTSIPSGSTRSSRSEWSTDLTPRWHTSPAMAVPTLTRSLRKMLLSPNDFWPASTARSRSGMRPRSFATAGSLDLAPKSASPPAGCMPAAQLGWSS